jgi:hypothetical protein
MARVDCPFCGKIGSLYAERIVRGQTAVTTYYCDACQSEWDEREDDERREVLRPRKRPPMTRADKQSQS